VDQPALPGTSPVRTFPDGFLHRPGFLSPAEEAQVRAQARALPFAEFRMRGFVAKRRRAERLVVTFRALRAGEGVRSFARR
jgi:hypothetical protein